ncbi:hypothetical protein R0131_13690 [Clostridium sp. AL.422]|uniref:IS1/IS1595 family N-terminal zinc-binding domain-containing protein n=1 Tax=Clostridium TaxID=1485 RepID=UPI00293DA6B8|nr:MULTISPECIES: hypothetical protein [unclassified Clostridium]MDV4151876.1 hypothetical protein [Clostridium sp. AL.422]
MKHLLNLNEVDNDFIENKFEILKEYENNLILFDIIKDMEINSCPHCKETKFIKYGKYRGIQRFRCTNLNCRKTFSPKTNTLLYNSKKPLELWIKFLILMNNGKSLRECSCILNINLATAFFWRHKILISHIKNNDNILKNYVEISKIILKENFKGNRSAKFQQKENIFIACGIDSNNTIISKPISRYTISLSAINKNFSQNIDNQSIVAAYNDRYLEIYARKHNSSSLPISRKKILSLVQQLINNKVINKMSDELITINEYLQHKNIFIHKFSLKIRKWLKRFRGVATKYLENYLNWHIIEFRNNYETFLIDQIKLFKEEFLESNYIKIKDLSNYKIVY